MPRNMSLPAPLPLPGRCGGAASRYLIGIRLFPAMSVDLSNITAHSTPLCPTSNTSAPHFHAVHSPRKPVNLYIPRWGVRPHTVSRHCITTTSTTTPCPPDVSRITSLSGTSFAAAWRFSPQPPTSPREPPPRRPGAGETETRPRDQWEKVGTRGGVKWGPEVARSEDPRREAVAASGGRKRSHQDGAVATPDEPKGAPKLGRCALTHPEWLNPPVRAGGLSHSGWVYARPVARRTKNRPGDDGRGGVG